MTRRRVSNPLALAVLSCLIEKPMHPYEMSRTLRERHKEGSIKLNYGSLYSVVEKLEKHGLIQTVETIRDGNRPERTVYRATSSGRAEFEDWLAELLSTPMKEYTQFEAGLSLLGGLPPDEVVALLDRRCIALEIELEKYEVVARDAVSKWKLARVFMIESEYVAMQWRAELAWVRQLIEDIRTGDLADLDLWQALHDEGLTGEEVMERAQKPAEEREKKGT